MNLIKFLNQVKDINNLIIAKRHEQDDLIKEPLRAPEMNPDRVQTSTKNLTEERNLKIAEIEMEIEEQIQGLLAIKRKVSKTIDLLEDYNERSILNLRYVQLKSYDEICEILYLSERSVFNYRAKGISNLEKICSDLQ